MKKKYHVRKHLILLLLCIVLFGFSSPEEQRTSNRKQIITLSKGLKKTEVLTHMGDIEARDYDTSGTYTINNPYKSESLYSKKNTFEVLYYHTDLKGRDRSLQTQELTPLILKDNKLTGWGWQFLQETIRKNKLTTETE